MIRLFEKYMMGAAMLRNADGGAGDGGQGGSGGQAGAGGQGGAGDGQGGAGGQGGQQQGGAPWFKAADYGFDEPTTRFYEGKNYPDLKTALNSLRHADEAARSRNTIERPDPTKPGDWKGFNDLGWAPEKDKYAAAIKKPQIEGADPLSDPDLTAFVDMAHDAKLAPFQAQKVLDTLHKMDVERSKNEKSRGAAAKLELDKKLRTEWGAMYDSKIEMAKRAFSFLGADEFSPEEISAAIGSPRTAKLFAKLGELIGEDKMPAPGQGGGSATNAATAKSERINLESDPAWMAIFKDPRHPKHNDYVAHRHRLIEIEAKGSRAA